ncbi:MAG: hypothetical protein ACM3QW_03455 [Ignavibacteriales bacterium]
MAIVNIDPNTYEMMIVELTLQSLEPLIRIDLRFAGCCDPFLGLWADEVKPGDLVHQVGDLTFIIESDIFDMVGEVTIAYSEKPWEKGFVLTSQHPTSEWEGTGVCSIRK